VSSNTLAGSLMSVELSPKKALSRASTFAEKLWKRTRTSSMASHSDAGTSFLSTAPPTIQACPCYRARPGTVTPATTDVLPN
jgi:hypothetical protein